MRTQLGVRHGPHLLAITVRRSRGKPVARHDPWSVAARGESGPAQEPPQELLRPFWFRCAPSSDLPRAAAFWPRRAISRGALAAPSPGRQRHPQGARAGGTALCCLPEHISVAERGADVRRLRQTCERARQRHSAASSLGATCFLRLMTPGRSIAPSFVGRPKMRSTRPSSPETSSLLPFVRMSVIMRTKSA